MPTSPVPHTSASSVSRRSFLHAAGAATLATGFAGAFGSHQSLLAAESVLSPPRAQQAILIHLVGGVSQLETFDPKPHAPAEIRSPAGAISTALPGVHLSGWLPKIAGILDRCTLIRSIHHDGPATHEAGLSALWTGQPLGSPSTSHLGDQLARHWGTDPARSHLVLSDHLGDFGWESIAALRPLAALWKNLAPASREQSLAKTKPGVADETYGASTLGRRCLRARRLLEAGTRVVTIHDSSTVFDQVTWDMHTTGARLPASLRDYEQTLCPALDQAVSTLILDLEQRGLLDHTLVAVVTEMGRTSRFNLYGGRDHHPGAWSVLLAGGGLPRGAVWGATDDHADEVRDQPISAAQLHNVLLGAA